MTQGILVVTGLLLVLTAAAFVRLYYAGIHARKESISQQVHQQAEQFQQRMGSFFLPVINGLTMTRQLAENRVISLESSALTATESAILPILRNPSLSIRGCVLADTRGRELKWIFTAGQWQRVAPEQPTQEHPWFEEVLKFVDNNEVRWSGLDTFHAHQKPGVTVAQAFTLDGGELCVIAFDIALDDFVLYMTTMDFSAGTQLLMYQDKKIADLLEYSSLLTDSESGPGEFWKDISGLKDSAAVAAASAWVKEGMPLDAVVQFSDGRQDWQGRFQHWDMGHSKTHLAVLVPESAMMQAVDRRAVWIFVWTSAALMAMVIGLIFLLRRQNQLINERFAYSGHTGKKSDELLSVIAGGEDNQLEFKSTLRWHLKAGKPAKEIEIACMKTLAAFLNSSGGTLLVGAKDNGDILGIEQDGFANDDKFLLHFNNLIKQHLGLECASLIDFEINHIDDRGVLVVDCRPAATPVFVKQTGKEDFYIRVGPGSRQLAASEMLAYLNDHFK